MATQTEIRKAFEKADAILRLEGFEPTNTGKSLQEAVVRGQMTFDEAVQAAIGKFTPPREGAGE